MERNEEDRENKERKPHGPLHSEQDVQFWPPRLQKIFTTEEKKGTQKDDRDDERYETAFLQNLNV